MLTGKFPLPMKIPRQRSTKTFTHALEDFPQHEKSDITPTKLALDKVYAALPEQSGRSEEGKPKWGCYITVSLVLVQMVAPNEYLKKYMYVVVEIMSRGGWAMDSCKIFCSWSFRRKLNPNGRTAFRSIGKKRGEKLRIPGGKLRSVSWDWGFHLPNRKRVQTERCYAGDNLRINSDSEAASRVWAHVCWIGWAYWRKQISAHRLTERVTIKSEDRVDSLHSQLILNQKQMRVQRTWGEQAKPNHFNTKLESADPLLKQFQYDEFILGDANLLDKSPALNASYAFLQTPQM